MHAHTTHIFKFHVRCRYPIDVDVYAEKKDFSWYGKKEIISAAKHGLNQKKKNRTE